MRKLICVCSLVLAALPLAFSQDRNVAFRFFVPIDFAGQITFSPSSSVDYNYDTNAGFGVGAEVVAEVWDGLSVGAGIQGDFGRGINDYINEDATFGFVPVYGLVDYRLGIGTVNPYAIARIGYNIPTGNEAYANGHDLAGGVFFTIGGGAELKVHGWSVQPFAEVSYAFDSSGYVENNTDISYKRLQLCLGAAYRL